MRRSILISMVVIAMITSSSSPVLGQIVSANAGHVNNQVPPSTAIGFETDDNIYSLSYHCWNNTDVINSCAKSSTYNKPIIISDDNSSSGNVNLVKTMINETVINRGQSYEHYDPPLTDYVLDNCTSLGNGAIDSVNDFPANSVTILDHISKVLSGQITYNSKTYTQAALESDGYLSRSGTQFYWNAPGENPRAIRLVGFSDMGAMVSKKFDFAGYLDVLEDYKVNLTRVWCIEQWTATCNGNDYNAGYVPFSGSKGSWNLYGYNSTYFSRLNSFVGEAAARGIVVQLSLFDRHGVRNTGSPGQWGDSPYNTSNNIQSFLSLIPYDDVPAFLGVFPSDIWSANEAFVNRVLQELSGYGNVIYEIMNEPLNDWSNSDVALWHKSIADVIGPADYYEDFDYTDPTLNGDLIQSGNANWAATNAQRKDGVCKPKGNDTQIIASIPVNWSGKTKAVVELDMVRITGGYLYICFTQDPKNRADVDNKTFFFKIQKNGTGEIAYKHSTTGRVTLTSWSTAPQGWVNGVMYRFRLEYNLSAQTIGVYVKIGGSWVAIAQDVSVGTLPFTIGHVGFQGRNASGTIYEGDCAYDNFEYFLY